MRTTFTRRGRPPWKDREGKNVKTRRAFSMIEILVVLAIIGILAGLLLPALAASRRHAKIKAAEETCRNVAGALFNLKSDKDYDGALGRALDANTDGTLTVAELDKLDLARELDPMNPLWAATITLNPAGPSQYWPLLNRKLKDPTLDTSDVNNYNFGSYFSPKRAQTRNGTLVDPWSQRYRYRLETQTVEGIEYDIEKIISFGPDEQEGTKDDISAEVCRLRRLGSLSHEGQKQQLP